MLCFRPWHAAGLFSGSDSVYLACALTLTERGLHGVYRTVRNMTRPVECSSVGRATD